MVSCPNCHRQWDDGVTTCPVCGIDLDRAEQSEWIVLGEIDNKLAADFARETLKSYDIPAVILSRSGFFGDVGLTLNPFYRSGQSGAFEVSVPVDFVEEASDILDMTVGNAWRRKES